MKSISKLFVCLIVVFLVTPIVFSYDDDANYYNWAYTMSDDQGFSSSNSYSLNGVEFINNQNGNLVYKKPLKFIPKTASGNSLDLSITYNGSVGHIISSGNSVNGSDQKHNRFTAPEWIISLNGIALQVLNFENEAITMESSLNSDVALYDDVNLLIPGYHYCVTNNTDPNNWTHNVLMEDGTVKSFQSQNTSGGEGLALTLDNNDQTKAYIDESTGGLTIFKVDGSKIEFDDYHVGQDDWKTYTTLNGSMVMYLPRRFIDPYGDTIVVEYNYNFTNNNKLYGRPIVKSVGDITFDWGYLLDSAYSEYTFSMSTVDEGEIYTFEMASDYGTALNLITNKTRAMVTKIVDKENREETYEYKSYFRSGEDLSNFPYLLQAKDFILYPKRIHKITNFAGGFTKYSYLNDNHTNWDVGNSSGFPGDSMSFGYYIGSGVVPNETFCPLDYYSPCYRSDMFDYYGRDPFQVNMVSTITRWNNPMLGGEMISFDSLEYSWRDHNFAEYNRFAKTGYFSEFDTLITVKYHDSVSTDKWLCTPLQIDTFFYEQIYDYDNYSDQTGFYKSNWTTKLKRHSTYELYECPEATMTKKKEITNFWDEFRLPCSTITTIDGKSTKINYEYVYYRDTLFNLTFLKDFQHNVIKRSSIDPFTKKITSYYNNNYFSIISSTDKYYFNNIVDSQKFSINGTLLSKSFNEYYDSLSSLGYIGQLKESRNYLIENGDINDSLLTKYEYLKNSFRDIDNGGLKKVTDPLGNIVTYDYYELVPDTSLIWGGSNNATIDGPNPSSQFVADTLIASSSGKVSYSLSISGSNGNAGSNARILLNTSLIESLGNCNSCSSTGDFEVTAGDLIIVNCSMLDNTKENANAFIEAQSTLNYYSISSLFNPITYYEYERDGDIDTITTEFSNNGPFWYKRSFYNENDTLVDYQLVDSLGLLKKRVNTNGFVSEIAYDDINRVERIVLPYSYESSVPEHNQYTLKYSYYDLPDINLTKGIKKDTQVMWKLGQSDRKSKIYFDGNYRKYQSEVYDIQGNYDSVQVVYDHNDQVHKSIDQLENETTSNYDILGRKVKITFPDTLNSNITNSFSSSIFTTTLPNYPFNVPIVNDSLWLTSTIDENGHQIQSITDAIGQQRALRTYQNSIEYATTYFDYDDLGNLICVQKPEGDSVNYRFNSLGQLTTEWASDYDTITYQYNKNGNLFRKQDGNIRAKQPGGVFPYFQFFDYDDLSRPITSGILQIDHISLDTLLIDTIQEFFYDKRTSVNSLGRLSFNLSNENGYEYGEQYDYDARGRITDQKNIFKAEIDSTRTDSIHVELQEVAGSETSSFEITRTGTLSYYLFYASATGSDLSGIEISKNGVIIDSIYGPNAFYINTKIGTFPVSVGDYIELSLNIPIPDAAGTYINGYATYQKYDDYELVLSPKNVVGRTRDISYSYNLADEITSITYPDGMVVTYSYDDKGRLASIGDEIDPIKYAQYSYTNRSEVETMILGDTVQIVDYIYNDRGWLTSINGGTSDNTTRMFGENLYYDTMGNFSPANFIFQQNGNIAGQTISINNDDSAFYLYHYDDINRLTNTFEGTKLNLSHYPDKEAFTYDKNGNRQSYVLNGTVPYSYNYDVDTVNRLLSVDLATSQKSAYTYDDNGNLLTDSGKNAQFEYDIYNQLKTVTFPSSIGDDSLVFGYSTDGQRISKRYIHYYVEECGGGGDPQEMTSEGGLLDLSAESLGGGGTTQGLGGPGGPGEPPPVEYCTRRSETITNYVRSKLTTQVLAEYNGYLSTGLLRKYVYAGDKRIAMVDIEGNVFYYLNDHLGSSRVIVKEDGTIQDRYNRYLAFGGDDGSSTTLNNAYKYTGKPFDDEHGFDLFYYGARYYDANTGRFAAVDPLNGMFPAWNPYHYTYNNPLIFTDPSGENPQALTLSAGLMFSGAPPLMVAGAGIALGVGLVALYDQVIKPYIESRGNGQPQSIGEPDATRSKQPTGKTKPKKKQKPGPPNPKSKGKPEPTSKDPFPNGPLKEPSGIETGAPPQVPSGPTIGPAGVVVNPSESTTKKANDEDKGTKE